MCVFELGCLCRCKVRLGRAPLQDAAAVCAWVLVRCRVPLLCPPGAWALLVLLLCALGSLGAGAAAPLLALVLLHRYCPFGILGAVGAAVCAWELQRCWLVAGAAAGCHCGVKKK